MKALFIIFLATLVVGALAFIVARPGKISVKSRLPAEVGGFVSFTTDDGVRIAADYRRAEGNYAAILLHMMPADRKSYRGIAAKLENNGISSLAIDLRGHGESSGGPTGYENFSDEDHQKSIKDVEAASKFLAEKGFDKAHQFLVGASIGANLALQFLVENEEVPAAVLLSPGLDYRGIKTEPLITRVGKGKFLLIAASEDDAGRADMARELYNKVPQGANATLLVYKNAGHGTAMFGKETPDLEEEIIRFLLRAAK